MTRKQVGANRCGQVRAGANRCGRMHRPLAIQRCALAMALIAVTAASARAQVNGENLLGDMGVKSGSQPEPGVYLANIYYRYFADSIKGPDGESVVLDPTRDGSQTIHAAVPVVIYVSSKKLFGANYGMMAVMPFANGALEAPGLGLSEEASAGPSDLYVMPVQLGWHVKRADVTTGLAFFAPTGRYTAGASDNLGKGMWSIGLAYYAQWKVSADQMGVSPSLTLAGAPEPNKHRVWGIGPEVTVPIATKTRLISLVNVRYLWETGAELKTQGQSLMVTTTFPIGGMSIPGK